MLFSLQCIIILILVQILTELVYFETSLFLERHCIVYIVRNFQNLLLRSEVLQYFVLPPSFVHFYLLPSSSTPNEYLVCVYTLKFFENCQQEIDNSKISSFVVLYKSSILQAGVVARKKELQQLYYKKILIFFKKLINFQWN